MLPGKRKTKRIKINSFPRTCKFLRIEYTEYAEPKLNLIELLEFYGLRSSRTTASQQSVRRGIAASQNDGVEKIERVSPKPRFFCCAT